MDPFKTILCATDFSAPARHAAARAFKLAGEVGASVTLLHVLNRSALDELRALLGMQAESVEQRLIERARAELNDVAAGVGAALEVAADVHVSTGAVLREVLDHADATDADLLVLGARGESFLRHTLLGATAARLLRKSVRRPVLVVKQAPHEAYRSVLIAVDFSPVSLHAIRTARQVAPDADLVLLHAFELPYESKLAFAGVAERVIRQYVTSASETRRIRLHDLAAAAGLAPMEFPARVIHGDPSQQIVAMEQEYDCDLIVVGKHGSHIAEELLLGSVTKHVLAESQCDVLVICDPREAPEQLP